MYVIIKSILQINREHDIHFASGARAQECIRDLLGNICIYLYIHTTTKSLDGVYSVVACSLLQIQSVLDLVPSSVEALARAHAK
jgi:hypothetical protein